MSPLMQTICDDLRAYALDRYIDGFERDAYAALPECCQALLQQYVLALNARTLMEQEAMFQAAFAAAKELS